MTDKLTLADYDSGSLENVTKRTVLSFLSRIFDPLGLYLPVTVQGKILMQEIWSQKCLWDDSLPKDLYNKWKKMESDFAVLSKYSFDRYAVDDDLSLVIFCDASKHLYGFSAYVRCVRNGKTETNLLFSKCKNAPTKSKSIPTLELLSVALAFKCLPTIMNSLQSRNVKDLFVCVDAQIVLSWILTKNIKTSNKNVFAKNRLTEIISSQGDIKDVYNLNVVFKYVPTELNPADLITRGMSDKDFTKNLEFWQRGPEFFRDSQLNWPLRQLGCLSNSNKSLMCTTLTDNTAETTIIPVDKYSDLNKLFRVTALVFKFISILKKSDVTEHLELARKYWFKIEQRKHLVDETKFLNDYKKSVNVPKNVTNLNLFLDNDGIMRSKGRIDKCEQFSYDVHNPILLPRESFLSDLFITDHHKRCMHLGTSSTLNSIRQAGVWITKGRAKVKNVLSKCVTCTRFNSFAYKYPKPTNFYYDKMKLIKPFEHTGIDYTGSFNVKLGEKVQKMYLLVFTCLNVRAIHLELLPDMTCEQFLLAFIRFSNVHCIPSKIYSDNASTFLQAMGILSKTNIDNDFVSYLSKNNIAHVRIPLYSAWIGSMWERMIRTIKLCLNKTVGRKRLEYFTFLTVLTDVCNAVNSRPLTHRDNDDLSYNVITPNSFLKVDMGRSVLFGSIAGLDFKVPRRKELVATLEKRETSLDTFKTLWFEDYIVSLRETGRDLYQNKWIEKIAVDDIVLIWEPGKSRTFWKCGKVVEKIIGSDGKARSVKVMKPDRSIATHAICHLYPTELSVASYISE